MQLQFRQRLAEIVLAGEPETVDGPLPVLPQMDLVDIGRHEVRLLEAGIENDRHQRLLDLAPERLPAVEEVTLHQLLRQRRAALHDAPRSKVGKHRPEDGDRVDAEVRVELAILHDLQRQPAGAAESLPEPGRRDPRRGSERCCRSGADRGGRWALPYPSRPASQLTAPACKVTEIDWGSRVSSQNCTRRLMKSKRLPRLR